MSPNRDRATTRFPLVLNIPSNAAPPMNTIINSVMIPTNKCLLYFLKNFIMMT